MRQDKPREFFALSSAPERAGHLPECPFNDMTRPRNTQDNSVPRESDGGTPPGDRAPGTGTPFDAGSPPKGLIRSLMDQPRDVWLVLLLCLAGLGISFLPALTPGLAFAPSHDTPHLTTPLLCEVGRHFTAGRFPLFDWTMLEPVSHNAHFSPLYPFYFAGLLNYCELLPAVAAHDLITVFHLILMFANALILARVAGLPALGAVFAAFIVTVSPNAFALAQWPTLVAPASWLPLAVAGLVAILYRDAWLRGTAMLVAGAGMMLLAAPATNLVASLVVLGLMLGAGSLIAAIADGSWRWKPFIWALCGVVSAGFVILIATGTTGNLLIALDDLIRWNRTGYVIGREVTGDFTREILTEQQGPRELLGVILPFRTPPLSTGNFFLGAIAFCLAGLGAWEGRREALTRTLVVMSGITLVLMYLDRFQLALVWSYIPGLSHTRHLSLLGGPFMMAAGLLAGRGFVALLRPEAARARRIVAVTLAVIALLTIPVLRLGLPFTWERVAPAILGMGVLAVILLCCGNRLAASRPGWLAAAVVVASGLVVAPQVRGRLQPIANSPAYTQTWRDMSVLVGRLAAADPEPGVFTFHGSIAAEGWDYTTAGTTARVLGLPSFQYFHSPRVHWKFFAQNYRFPDFATYGRLGGRYVLSQGPLEDPLLEPFGQEGTIFAYRIRGRRPLVVAICGVPRLPDEDGGNTARPRPSQMRLAPPALLAAGRAADAAPPGCPGEPVSGIGVDRSVESLRFTLAPVGAEFLVLNVPPYEGWRLTVGGRRLPIFALDDSRSIAAVPHGLSGPSALSFRPRNELIRMLLSVAGVGLLVLFFLWLAWRRPGPDRPLRLPAALSALAGRSTRLANFLQTLGLRLNMRERHPNS